MIIIEQGQEGNKDPNEGSHISIEPDVMRNGTQIPVGMNGTPVTLKEKDDGAYQIGTLPEGTALGCDVKEDGLYPGMEKAEDLGMFSLKLSRGEVVPVDFGEGLGDSRTT